jgi:hypothetical protein
LPLFYNDGKEIEKSKFLETKEELAAKFHGCTALTPAEGLWIDDDFSKYYDVNSGYLFRLSKFFNTINLTAGYYQAIASIIISYMVLCS